MHSVPFWAPASLPGATSVTVSEAQGLETGGNLSLQPWLVPTYPQE